MTPMAFGWNHVSQHYWLHHDAAVIRLRWQRVGPLHSYTIGQGDPRLVAAEFESDAYCGPILEFRYNCDAWAYSLNYPGIALSLVALAADVHACGVRLAHENHVEIRRDMGVLARWGAKNGYVVENGVWREA